jgi:glycosyltransferase involved in cell wall biosynthesis
MFVVNGVTVDARVRREAATLAAAGAEVVVLGLRERSQAEQEALDGFTVRRLRRDPFRRGLEGGAQPGALSRRLAPLSQGLAVLDYSIRALVHGFRLHADVYHAHDLVTLPVAWAAGRLRGTRVVYDAHELFTEIGRLSPWARRPLRWLEAFLIRRADRVITVNESIAGELSRRYGVPAPLVLLNCPRTAGRALRDGSGRLRARLGVAAGVPVALYQGMFMPHRGLENLVRAARGLRRAHVAFMGWGPLLDPLRALAVVEGVADRVHFMEGVPLSDLLEYTSGADVGLIPYRNVGLNNYYTSPNKLFEYCVAGVPVAASRLPELVKVVEGRGIGVTFDPERPDDIAAAVNGLLDDPARLAEVRANVARAAPSFTWEGQAPRLLDLYASLEGAR